MLQRSFLVVIVVASDSCAASMSVIDKKSLVANCITNQKGFGSYTPSGKTE